MRYNVRPSKKFQKDIKRLKRRGLDMSLPEASGQCPVRKSGDKAANPLYDNIIRQL